MRSNLELNGITAETYCAAVSSFAGRSFLSGSGCGARISGVDAPRTQSVPVIDLLAFLANLSPQALLLKIDIEGEERKLLPLLIPSLPKMCALFFEWHHQESAFGEIEATLREQGFSVRRNTLRPAADGCVYLDAFAIRT
jgi:hypothetical protein